MTDCYNATHISATRTLLVRKVALAVILVGLASTSRHWPGDTRSLTVSLPWEEKIEEFKSDDTALTQVYKLWKGWNSARTGEHLYSEGPPEIRKAQGPRHFPLGMHPVRVHEWLET